MSDANRLFHAVQATLAGQSEAAVMQALLTSLLAAVGVSAPSVARGEAMLDALPAELKPILRREWANYRKHRAAAAAETESGATH